MTGGSFSIKSELGVGTVTEAVYVLSSIDRMPLGDMSQTIHSLVTMNTHIDFLYTYSADDKKFTLDTREFREILGSGDFGAPEVSAFIMDFLRENHAEVSDLAE